MQIELRQKLYPISAPEPASIYSVDWLRANFTELAIYFNVSCLYSGHFINSEQSNLNGFYRSQGLYPLKNQHFNSHGTPQYLSVFLPNN